jgi:hypothetical protein
MRRSLDESGMRGFEDNALFAGEKISQRFEFFDRKRRIVLAHKQPYAHPLGPESSIESWYGKGKLTQER